MLWRRSTSNSVHRMERRLSALENKQKAFETMFIDRVAKVDEMDETLDELIEHVEAIRHGVSKSLGAIDAALEAGFQAFDEAMAKESPEKGTDEDSD